MGTATSIDLVTLGIVGSLELGSLMGRSIMDVAGHG
jgi:hypothetical protein